MTATKTPENSTITKDWKPIYKRWWFWVIEVPFVIIFVGALLRIPFLNEEEGTQIVVEQIHAQKLTIADVMGDNLPPPPDPAQVDATIEGIDVNWNGIRDDVELAIFKKYPNSATIRAAELQYAKALQKELTLVFNSETFVATAQETSRASGCIADLTSRDNLKIYINNLKGYEKEVKDLQLNTKERISKENTNSQFLTSFGGLEGVRCDVEPTLIPS